MFHIYLFFFFFFNDTATTEIYTLSLHDALPISLVSWLMYLNVGTPPVWKTESNGRLQLREVGLLALIGRPVSCPYGSPVAGLIKSLQQPIGRRFSWRFRSMSVP